MTKSESIKAFAEAMAKFQGEVKNPPKTADNPFFKSKYTPLDVIIDVAKPLLNKHGLSYIQSCSGDGQNITVTTLLMHNSGEWVETDPLTLKADKATAQGAGSAITYGRRYALAAALGLASDEDDDGNGAELHKLKAGKTQPPETTQTPELEKRAAKIFFHYCGDKEGQLGMGKADYNTMVKKWAAEGHISNSFGKKWTEKDIEWLELQTKPDADLPF